jgi:hypothetical protein
MTTTTTNRPVWYRATTEERTDAPEVIRAFEQMSEIRPGRVRCYGCSRLATGVTGSMARCGNCSKLSGVDLRRAHLQHEDHERRLARVAQIIREDDARS